MRKESIWVNVRHKGLEFMLSAVDHEFHVFIL
jgi:hypothetical protein